MKELEINGRTLYYKLKSFDCGEYGVSRCYETHFFLKPTEKATKYWFWGPIIDIESWDPVFKFNYSIESVKKTKEDIRKAIEKELVLLDRDEEIKKGNII
jgi:hypothetical protein|tara:strand:- start:12630 stop:12929 length:300 start_codon:yes stop_codon:yes gene_type:complete